MQPQTNIATPAMLNAPSPLKQPSPEHPDACAEEPPTIKDTVPEVIASETILPE